MKYLYIIAVLVVIGGFWLVMDDDSEVSEVGEQNEEVSNQMPIIPTSDTAESVNEMEVTDVEGAEASDVVDEGMVAEKVFNIDSFSFGYSETEIRVKKGDTVTINLTNSDGFHDWVVDEFSVATDKIKKGEKTSVTFVASEAGTFEYYCSVGSHRAQGMVGKLIVE